MTIKELSESVAGLIIDSKPDFLCHVRFGLEVPKGKKRCTFLYYRFDPIENFWKETWRMAIEQLMIAALKPLLPMLTHAQRMHAHSRKGRGQVVEAIAQRCICEKSDT